MKEKQAEFVYRRHGVLHRQFPFGVDLLITETEMAFENGECRFYRELRMN